MSTTSGYRPQPYRNKLRVCWVQPPTTSKVIDKYNATTVEYRHRLLSETILILLAANKDEYSQRLFSATTPKNYWLQKQKSATTSYYWVEPQLGQPQVIMRPPHRVIGSREGSDYGCVAVSTSQNPAKPQNSMRRHTQHGERRPKHCSIKKDVSRSEKKGLVSSFDISIKRQNHDIMLPIQTGLLMFLIIVFAKIGHCL